MDCITMAAVILAFVSIFLEYRDIKEKEALKKRKRCFRNWMEIVTGKKMPRMDRGIL